MQRFALFALGFRPFYLLASVFAALSIPLWALQFSGLLQHPYLSGPLWHAHEMLFGFTLAVIVGFLLTAGRNWTNQPTPTAENTNAGDDSGGGNSNGGGNGNSSTSSGGSSTGGGSTSGSPGGSSSGNTLDYSSYGSAMSAVLGKNVATGLANFGNIQALVGSAATNNTLVGANVANAP